MQKTIIKDADFIFPDNFRDMLELLERVKKKCAMYKIDNRSDRFAEWSGAFNRHGRALMMEHGEVDSPFPHLLTMWQGVNNWLILHNSVLSHKKKKRRLSQYYRVSKLAFYQRINRRVV